MVRSQDRQHGISPSVVFFLWWGTVDTAAAPIPVQADRVGVDPGLGLPRRAGG